MGVLAKADSIYRATGRGLKSTSPGVKIAVEDRRDLVMKRTLSGKSARAIARELGVSNATVSRDIRLRLENAAASCPSTARYREFQRQRIDALVEPWWSKATDASDRRNLDVLDRVTKLLELQIKLTGLNVDPGTPTRPEDGDTEITVKYVMPKQIAAVEYAARVNVIDRIADRAALLEKALEPDLAEKDC